MINWEQFANEEILLFSKGFDRYVLTFQIGNYEDEDYLILFVKDDLALTHAYSSHGNVWDSGKLSNCNFHNGFDKNSQIVDINTL